MGVRCISSTLAGNIVENTTSQTRLNSPSFTCHFLRPQPRRPPSPISPVETVRLGIPAFWSLYVSRPVSTRPCVLNLYCEKQENVEKFFRRFHPRTFQDPSSRTVRL